jgi:hypothetical protein
MSVNVVQIATALPISLMWALPWQRYRGLRRFSAPGVGLATPVRGSGERGTTGARAGATAAARGGTDCFKAAR